MKKIIKYMLIATVLGLGFSITASTAGPIKNGNCPRLDEVRVHWELLATSEPDGGWKFEQFAPRESGTARADEFYHCSTRKSPSSNKYNNEIICTYWTDWNDNPQPLIYVKKKKPKNYKCACDSDNGKYRCEVK